MIVHGVNLPARDGTSGSRPPTTGGGGRRSGTVASASALDGVEAEHVEADADAEIGGQEHVGVAEAAHQHVARRPRPDAGDVDEAGGDGVTVGADVEHELVGGDAAGELDDRALALAGHRQQRRIDRRRALGGREHVGDGPPSMASGSPTAATMRPATAIRERGAAAGATAWPTGTGSRPQQNSTFARTPAVRANG